MKPSRVLAAVGVSLTVLLGAAAPAAAHGGAVESIDYRARISSVDPAVPGLHIRLIEAGGRVELVNRTGEDVVVLGYEGEPYLRIGPGGVFENRRSPAVYLNASRTGGVPVPDGATGDAEPRWVRTGDGPTARWHDHRLHWMTSDPEIVRAEPDARHRVAEWQLVVLAGDASVEVTGTIDYVPGPPVWPWLVGAAVLAAAVVVARRSLLAAAVLLLVLVDLVRVAGLTVVVRGDIGERLEQAVEVGSWSALGWVLGVGAVVRLLGRHADGLLLAGLAGIVLGVTGGVLEWDDIGRSQLAFAAPADVARLCVAAATGLGAGVTGAVLLETAHPSRAATRPAP